MLLESVVVPRRGVASDNADAAGVDAVDAVDAPLTMRRGDWRRMLRRRGLTSPSLKPDPAADADAVVAATASVVLVVIDAAAGGGGRMPSFDGRTRSDTLEEEPVMPEDMDTEEPARGVERADGGDDGRDDDTDEDADTADMADKSRLLSKAWRWGLVGEAGSVSNADADAEGSGDDIG